QATHERACACLLPLLQVHAGRLEELVERLNPPPPVVPQRERDSFDLGRNVREQVPRRQDLTLLGADFGEDQAEGQGGPCDAHARTIRAVLLTGTQEPNRGFGNILPRRLTAIENIPCVPKAALLFQRFMDL